MYITTVFLLPIYVGGEVKERERGGGEGREGEREREQRVRGGGEGRREGARWRDGCMVCVEPSTSTCINYISQLYSCCLCRGRRKKERGGWKGREGRSEGERAERGGGRGGPGER